MLLNLNNLYAVNIVLLATFLPDVSVIDLFQAKVFLLKDVEVIVDYKLQQHYHELMSALSESL